MGLKFSMAKGHTPYVGWSAGGTWTNNSEWYTCLIHWNIFTLHTQSSNAAVDCMRPAGGGLETRGTEEFQPVTWLTPEGQWAQLKATYGRFHILAAVQFTFSVLCNIAQLVTDVSGHRVGPFFKSQHALEDCRNMSICDYPVGRVP